MLTKRDISFTYLEYDNVNELDTDDQELVSIAKETAGSAYAPYSKFNVGAALRLESGRIIRGCNVENAAFPSGFCAERAAIAGAVSNYGGDKPVVMAIAAASSYGITEECVSPCGNCRQVLSEEEVRSGNNIRVILAGKNKIMIVESVSHLLPLGFSIKNLRLDRS